MKEPENLIVCRYARVTYHGLGGIEAHGKRLGEDLDHVDRERTGTNEFLVGHPHLRDIADARIAGMQQDNAARKAAGLRRSRHRRQAKELEAAIEVAGDDPHALAEVIGWPWDNKNVKPFTEGIISVSHDWFLDGRGAIDPAKLTAFRAFATGYLEEEFGSEVLYARLDLDEKTPHVSFVVAPEHENRKTKRRELSHRQHRLFGMEEVQTLFEDEEPDPKLTRRSYEILQDRIADYARKQGLDVARGERRAETERMKRELGETVLKRRNVSPARGRELVAALASEAEEERDGAAKERAAAEADKEKARTEREDAAELVVEATSRRNEAEALQADAGARTEAIDIGTEAIMGRELAYAAPSEKRAEGLTWGPNRPDASRRSFLRDAIQPARDWLVGFARRVQSLFDREAALEGAEAETRRRARLVLLHEERLDRRASPGIEAVAEKQPMELAEADFPEAWAFSADAKPEKVKEQIDAARNLQLRTAFQATRDAVNLCEGSADLQDRFRRGLDVIEASAEERGFNLETGVQDTRKASNPELAARHGDELPMPIRVVRKALERQRVRS